MGKISSDVRSFRISNPKAKNSEIIAYLKKLGWSQIDINNYLSSIIEIKDDETKFDIEKCQAEAVPDLDNAFDLPDDILDEFKDLT